MKYKHNYFHSNTKAMCKENLITLKSLYETLKIKPKNGCYSLLAAIRICNYFDVSIEIMVDSEFTNLT